MHPTDWSFTKQISSTTKLGPSNLTMGLKERIEIMFTLDQLSDEQYATLTSKLFVHDRKTTNQFLAGYFAANINAPLATKIKKTAKSMIQSQDPGKEPMAQTVMTDPHILSNIALYLPNHLIFAWNCYVGAPSSHCENILQYTISVCFKFIPI